MSRRALRVDSRAPTPWATLRAVVTAHHRRAVTLSVRQPNGWDDLAATVSGQLTRDLFGLLTGDEDARVCKDIPDAACNDQPRNFVLQLVSLSATGIGDQLANPKLVLLWLLNAVGAPPFLLAWLVPLRESLALLPQLLVAALIRRAALRKWFWVAGSVGQGCAVLVMAVIAVNAHGVAAGWGVLGALVAEQPGATAGGGNAFEVRG